MEQLVLVPSRRHRRRVAARLLKRKRTEPYVHSQPHKIQTTPHDSLRNLTLSPWSARDIYAMPCQLLLCQQVRSC